MSVRSLNPRTILLQDGLKYGYMGWKEKFLDMGVRAYGLRFKENGDLITNLLDPIVPVHAGPTTPHILSHAVRGWISQQVEPCQRARSCWWSQ